VFQKFSFSLLLLLVVVVATTLVVLFVCYGCCVPLGFVLLVFASSCTKKVAIR